MYRHDKGRQNPSDIFTPSKPIHEIENLIGRSKELERCVDGLSEEGSHIAIYGSRGVGKTSLLNIFLEIATDLNPEKIIIKYECAHGDTYKEIFYALLTNINCHKSENITNSTHEQVISADAKIPFASGSGKSKNTTHTTIEDHWETELRPSVLAKKYLDNAYIFIIDEFDRITDKETKIYISDVLKTISDNRIKSKFILVGISDTKSTLIGKHPSVDRCVKSVHVQPLSRDGISELLNHGFSLLRLTCSKRVTDLIGDICSGYPHYAHLSGLELARYAEEKNKKLLNIRDYNKVVNSIVSNISGSNYEEFSDFIFPKGEAEFIYDNTRDIDSLKKEIFILSASKHERISFDDLTSEMIGVIENKINFEKNNISKRAYSGLFGVGFIDEGEIELMIANDKEMTFRIITTGVERMIEFVNPMVKIVAWFSLTSFLGS